MKSQLIMPAAAMMLLGGCASMGQKNGQKTAEDHWDARSAQLEKVDRFLKQARASFVLVMPVLADRRWLQIAVCWFVLRVSGPFGVGATTVSVSPDYVQV